MRQISRHTIMPILLQYVYGSNKKTQSISFVSPLYGCCFGTLKHIRLPSHMVCAVRCVFSNINSCTISRTPSAIKIQKVQLVCSSNSEHIQKKRREKNNSRKKKKSAPHVIDLTSCLRSDIDQKETLTHIQQQQQQRQQRVKKNAYCCRLFFSFLSAGPVLM